MIFTTSDGIELYYEKSGKGIPCLFLHGGPGYWSKSFQLFAGPLLEDSLEMIYLDQRGCGRSGHSVEGNYLLSRLLDDIEEWRKNAGIDEMYIMAHSFGGILAVNYADTFPERVKGLILTNVTLNMLESFEHQFEKGNALLEVKSKELLKGNLEEYMNQIFVLFSKLIEKDLYYTLQFSKIENLLLLNKVDKEDEFQSDPHFQKTVLSSNEYFQDFTILTKHIKKPVLVIAGERDHSIGPDHHLSFHFPSSTISVLKSSHHPYLEDSIHFKKIILKFLQENKVFS